MGQVLFMFQRLFVVSQVIKKIKYTTDRAVLKVWHYKCKTNSYFPFSSGLFVTFGFFAVAADIEVISSIDFLKLFTLELHINPIHCVFFLLFQLLYLFITVLLKFI